MRHMSSKYEFQPLTLKGIYVVNPQRYVCHPSYAKEVILKPTLHASHIQEHDEEEKHH